METQSGYGLEVAGCHAWGVAAPRFFRVQKAMLCLDCDTVFEVGGPGRCPACGSTAVAPVSRWLDHDPAPMHVEQAA